MTTLSWDHADHALKTIGQLGLVDGKQFTLLCQCMSPLATAIKDGRITSQSDLKKLIEEAKKIVEVPQAPKQYLRLLSEGKEFRLGKTEGKKTIKAAKKLLAAGIYFYDGFNELSDEVVQTEELLVEVSELVESGKFAEFLPDGRVFQHEEQVLLFCETHRDWLRKDGYATFFPFLKSGKVFVADARVCGVGQLEVLVRSLGRDCAWDADDRDRVVLPQLALKP